MSKIYVGGSLFSEGEIAQRIKEEQLMKDNLPTNTTIYNPITNDDINDKNNNPTSIDVFNQDTTEIFLSDIMTAPIDSEDPGLMFELGVVYSKNFFSKLVKNIVNEILNDCNEKGIGIDLSSFKDIYSLPFTKVYPIISDIRTPGAGNYEDKYVPKGLNQYVIGGLEAMDSDFSNGIDEVIEKLKVRLQEEKNV